MQCPKCKHKIEKGDRSCRECGTKLPLICPRCGHEVKPDDRFCAGCGAELGEATIETTDAAIPKLVGIVNEYEYEGSISGFRGDGLLALFGVPILHESDSDVPY